MRGLPAAAASVKPRANPVMIKHVLSCSDPSQVRLLSPITCRTRPSQEAATPRLPEMALYSGTSGGANTTTISRSSVILVK